MTLALIIAILLQTPPLQWKAIKEASHEIEGNKGLTIETYAAQIRRNEDIVKLYIRFDFPWGFPRDAAPNIASSNFDVTSISRIVGRLELNCKTLTVKPDGSAADVYQFNGKKHKSKELPFTLPPASLFADYFCETGTKPTTAPTLKKP